MKVYRHLVQQIWVKEERVGFRLRARSKAPRISKITIVTQSPEIAFQLERNLRRQYVRTLRVNRLIRAIVQEMHPIPNDNRMVIDGLGNLGPNQRRTLEQIGLTRMATGQGWLGAGRHCGHGRKIIAWVVSIS